jgi:hypothetical protein
MVHLLQVARLSEGVGFVNKKDHGPGALPASYP